MAYFFFSASAVRECFTNRLSSSSKNRRSSRGFVRSNLGAARSPRDGIVVVVDIVDVFIVVDGNGGKETGGNGIGNGNGDSDGDVLNKDNGSEVLVGDDSVLDGGCVIENVGSAAMNRKLCCRAARSTGSVYRE